MTLIRVVISGRSASPVLLEDLKINVISRRPPPSGSYISYTGLGAGVSTRFVDVDLDSQTPRWQFIGDDGEPTDNPFPLQVTDTEVEVFDIDATTLRCDCTWNAELLYSADGDEGTLSINNGDEPFETTAIPGRTPKPGRRRAVSAHLLPLAPRRLGGELMPSRGGPRSRMFS